MSVYYQDDTVKLLLGDAASVAATLEPQSIQTVVTSPPYFGLRDYGVDGQLGAEKLPAEFIANLVAVFEAIRPALADDGVLWVNLGDSYAGSGKGREADGTHRDGGKQGTNTGSIVGSLGKDRSGVPAKNLLMIPARFAIAMQDAGWILRNDIIWAKPNGMPESVTDRMSTRHEHLFMFSKRARYWFNLDPIREPRERTDRSDVTGTQVKYADSTARLAGRNARSVFSTGMYLSDGRNPGDVWTIPTQPYPGAHFAVFPPTIPERCILASTRPGDTVLDPFSGSGTTGMVATKHGRHYIGIDLNPEYHDLALKTRLAQGVLA